MPNAIKPLAQVVLGAVLGPIYAPPAAPLNGMAVIKSIWICNTDAAGRLVTLRYGPAGTLTAANSLLEQSLLAAHTSWYIDAADSLLTLVAGTLIMGASDVAGKIVVTVSGEEIR